MKIVQKAPFKVVGIKVVANWEDLWVEMPKAWQKFISRHQEIQRRVSKTFIDISLDKEGQTYTQLIGSEVSDFEAIPEGMVGIEIPAQTYIHYRHEGPVKEIAASFGKMHAWADENRYAVDDFKVDIGYTEEGQEQEHDLFIRLVTTPAPFDTLRTQDAGVVTG